MVAHDRLGDRLQGAPRLVVGVAEAVEAPLLVLQVTEGEHPGGVQRRGVGRRRGLPAGRRRRLRAGRAGDVADGYQRRGGHGRCGPADIDRRGRCGRPPAGSASRRPGGPPEDRATRRPSRPTSARTLATSALAAPKMTRLGHGRHRTALVTGEVVHELAELGQVAALDHRHELAVRRRPRSRRCPSAAACSGLSHQACRAASAISRRVGSARSL